MEECEGGRVRRDAGGGPGADPPCGEHGAPMVQCRERNVATTQNKSQEPRRI
jgi:hypothetical protein